jgi:hypothetical protein
MHLNGLSHSCTYFYLLHIIRTVHCDYNHQDTPTNAHNLYKITNHPYTGTLLHASQKNRRRQGDVNMKEYKMNTSSLHVQCLLTLCM